VSDALWGVLLGGGVGVAGTILGVFTDSWLRRGERRADVRERRRQEAAHIVGPALASLRDLDPNANVGALRGNPRAQEALREKWDAWLRAAGGLEVLGATHPDTSVAELCESVITTGSALLNRLHYAITEAGAQSQEWWDEVNGLRDQGVSDARQLVRAVLEQPA
jgi:hypothetical protein